MESEKNYHNFERNLLKASYANNLKDATKEWVEITTKQYESKETCICNHKIKTVVFMYNSLTHKTIMVGTACFKKFVLNVGCKRMHSVLKSILVDFLNKVNILTLMICFYIANMLKVN